MEKFYNLDDQQNLAKTEPRRVWVNGAVIVGAGPAGLATAACLKDQSIPTVVLERADCIASLWQKRTYDRLKLHLPKQFCQLPNLPLPDSYPEYPTKRQFIDYLENYAQHFGIKTQFNECVNCANYNKTTGLWRVKTSPTGDISGENEVEYICKWLVVATGENAEYVMPEIDGLDDFAGEIMHACQYKSGEKFAGKKVLVVGCGNSGMELSLDLSHHKASPSMVVRTSVHVLPREIMGLSTFQVAVTLMSFLPLWFVDKILLLLAWLILGSTEKLGVKRPSVGPMQLKRNTGKTPVLDIGALEKIRSGDINVVAGIKKIFKTHVELVDGNVIYVDAMLLATGYHSNVPSWLKEDDFFDKKGFPKASRLSAWKKSNGGLYAVGFTRRGLLGVSSDAVRVAEDIGKSFKEETMKSSSRGTGCQRRCISVSF